MSLDRSCLGDACVVDKGNERLLVGRKPAGDGAGQGIDGAVLGDIGNDGDDVLVAGSSAKRCSTFIEDALAVSLLADGGKDSVALREEVRDQCEVGAERQNT